MSTKLGDITLTKKSGTTLTLNTKEKYVNDDVSFNISVVEGSVTQNAPTVDETGLVTATTSTAAGFVPTSATADSKTLQLSTKGAETYPFTTLGSATIPAGKYLTGDQTILQAYTSGIEAGNIKYGTTVKVGDSQNNGRIHNVAGTFTKANTVSSGYIAATSDKILSGYSAWVDGAEVLGTATGSASQTKSVNPTESEQTVKPDSGYLLSAVTVGAISSTYVGSEVARNDSTDLQVSGKTITAPAGYYAENASANVALGTVKSGSANISSVNVAYDSTNGDFNVTGSANISAPTVQTAGYVSTTEGTKSANNGAATVNANLAKVTGTVGFSGASTRKPSISKQSTPSGVVNAASGDATTTEPSSGVYVAVKSSANTGTLTATPSVSTEGYGTIAAHGFAANTQTVGALASDTTYVPIATTSASVSGKTVSYGSGWITEGSNSVADGSVTPAINSHTITAPSVACKTNGTGASLGTTTKPSGTDGTDYWTFTPSGTGTNGSSVSNAKATVSAGYIASNPANSDNDIKAIVPTVNNGTTKYIQKAASSTSNGTATATNGTASTSVIGMVTTSTNTGYSVSASATGGSASVTASSVTVGEGYNPSSVTASTTAQNASGESASQTKYIQKGALTASVSSNTSGSASMSATGFTPLSSGTSDYYVSLTTSAGSVKAKAQVYTEGYVKTETNETAATGVAVTGNGSKVYIPAGGVTQNAPTVNTTNGLVTATSSVAEGYVAAGTKSNTLQLSTVNGATVSPTESEQTAVAANKYTLGAVKVGAISSTYVGSGIARKSSSDLTANGATVTAPAGYYGSAATKTISSTSVTEGTTTVSSGTATRGTWSQTAGYTTARTIAASTFANSATSGQTYVDISNTTAAPVLVAGDYLYINKGYSDNLKISLAKLVPDGSDVKGHGEYIISGHSAYDNDGTLVAGTIPTIASTDLQVSGKTVTVPVGKYTGASGATAVSASVADGSVTPAVNSHSVTTTPVVTGALSGTVTNIGTTTKPSGTDGTDYWTITPSGSVTTTGKSTTNAKATVSAGYIATSPANSGNSVIDITPTINAGTARYLTKATSSTSNGTATATNGTASTSVTGMVTTSTNTGYSVSASATGGNASVTASSATVGAGYNPSSVTASTTAKSATGTSASDTKYIQKGALSASVSSNSSGSASMAATGFTAASSATSYYVTLSTSAGSVKAKASVGTEGYVKTETNETAATSVAVSGNGNKLYVPAGGYAGSVSSHSITTTPVVTGALSGTGTSIGTTTKPSGTDGTDYWAFTPGGSVTTTGVSTAKGKATISTAGYIPTGNNESSASTVNITPTASNGTTRYLPKAVIAGSSTNATATTTVAPGTVSVTKQSTPSGVTNAASGNATTTAPSSGVYVAVKATAAANSTGTTSSISGSGSATVSTAGYAPTTLTGSVSVSGTATAKTSAKDSSVTYVPITTANPAFTGGGLSGTATASSSTASISDSTNNSGVSIATACTATRANVTYNGAVNGWVSKTSGTTALSSGSTAMTAKTYYVNGVTITKPSSGTRTFSVTVPNGSTTATFVFNVDSSGNVTITES